MVPSLVIAWRESYNRYEYLEERRAALEKWARRIQIIASGKPAEVVKLWVSWGVFFQTYLG